MRRLILFRHAKTEARAPSGGDFDRRLTERGHTDARLVGKLLAKAGFAPDLALVSPAVRSRQTWDEVKADFPDAKVEFRHSLYHAGEVELAVEIIPSARAAGTLMVIGHNPAMQELAVSLLAERGAEPAQADRIAAGFPTAAAAVLAFDADNKVALERFIRPSEYR